MKSVSASQPTFGLVLVVVEAKGAVDSPGIDCLLGMREGEVRPMEVEWVAFAFGQTETKHVREDGCV